MTNFYLQHKHMTAPRQYSQSNEVNSAQRWFHLVTAKKWERSWANLSVKRLQSLFTKRRGKGQNRPAKKKPTTEADRGDSLHFCSGDSRYNLAKLYKVQLNCLCNQAEVLNHIFMSPISDGCDWELGVFKLRLLRNPLQTDGCTDVTKHMLLVKLTKLWSWTMICVDDVNRCQLRTELGNGNGLVSGLLVRLIMW